jgi:hypothetical protein
MNTTELLAVFREEMGDEEAPHLWSDSLLFSYMNEAQEMFCRETEGIEDSSTVSVCRLSVVPDTEWYPISPKILKLRRATRTDTGRPVRLLNFEKAPDYGVLFDGKPGPLNTLVTGAEKSKLRAWPMPNETITVELSVFRLPLEIITDEGNQELEIDSQHHLPLVMWMKHRAYGKEDAETYDRRKADDFQMRFMAYCDRARQEQTRARREVGTVAYGGI